MLIWLWNKKYGIGQFFEIMCKMFRVHWYKKSSFQEKEWTLKALHCLIAYCGKHNIKQECCGKQEKQNGEHQGA